jgi:two-component system, NarL family, response regulator DegU
MKKIDVIITDDHKLFRLGIRSILTDFDFVENIYEAGSGKELIEILSGINKIPEIILLDLKMPEMDGMEATEKIKKLYPDIKIIILTMEDDEQVILHAISEGVNGYLMKNAEPDELEKAIKMLITNEYYFSDNITSLILRSIQYKKKNEPKESCDLSDREIEILKMICNELTAVEIADILLLSVRTVEGYKGKLLEKTKSKNIAGLVIYAIKNEIISI